MILQCCLQNLCHEQTGCQDFRARGGGCKRGKTHLMVRACSFKEEVRAAGPQGGGENFNPGLFSPGEYSRQQVNVVELSTTLLLVAAVQSLLGGVSFPAGPQWLCPSSGLQHLSCEHLISPVCKWEELWVTQGVCDRVLISRHSNQWEAVMFGRAGSR